MNIISIDKLIIIWLTMIFMSSLNAQEPEVKIWLDSSMIKIGEQVKVHLQVRKKPDTQVDISEFKDAMPSEIEIIGELSDDTVKNRDDEIISRIYTITSFDSGVHIIPSIPFAFFNKESSDTIRSLPQSLNVYYPEVDTSQAIKDIKQLIRTPFTFSESIPYLGIILGAIVIVAVIIYFYLRYIKKKRPLDFKKETLIPAHIIAFSELDRLKEEKLWQAGRLKEFYSRLSDIIRKYLENRFNFKTMECVTDEIMNDFVKVNHEQNVEEMLYELLHTSDMVKFAKADPLPSENQSILNNAYFIVEKTKLVEMKSLDELARESAEDIEQTNKEVVQ